MTEDAGVRRRIVLVTGASRGIGAAIARRFAAEAYLVLANDLAAQAPALGVLREAIVAAGGRCELAPADVSDPASVVAMVEKVAADHGAIDVLVNNAAAVFGSDDYISWSIISSISRSASTRWPWANRILSRTSWRPVGSDCGQMRSWLLEDSFAGAASAHHAGMRVFALSPSGAPVPPAEAVLRGLDELPDLILAWPADAMRGGRTPDGL